MRFLAALFLLFPLFSFSLGDLTITTPQGLIDFAAKVNSGTSYSDETVYLGADLDFTSSLSSSFVPIGKTTKYAFNGTFDGQGHTISNLAISSSYVYTGLFGISYGTTIKNVVIGNSCYITSTYSGSGQYASAASVIGYCAATKRKCSVEGVVNMASVTHSEIVSSNFMYIGGIVGRFYSPKYDSYVKSCVNYGPLLISGTNTYSSMGGILGGSHTGSSKNIYIQNCLNYGTITHSGTTTEELRVGGIMGWTYNTYINNCVGAGKISLSNTPSDTHKGAVVGPIGDNTNIHYTYFTSDVGLSILHGTIYSASVSITGSSNSSVNIDSSIVSSLNTQAASNNWNKWILNTNSNKITFKVNNNKNFSFSSQLILLPDLSDTGTNKFNGWFTDSAYTNSFTFQEISSATALYGLYGTTISVTLDGNGGTPSQQIKYSVTSLAYGTLPTVEREGYSFIGWFTEKDDGKGEEVTNDTKVETTSDHTLYAHWTINNYTLTFVFNNSIDADDVKILNYSDPIIDYYPVDPVRKGYSFNEWDNKGITNMPAYNLIVTAQWTPNNYTATFNATGGVTSEYEKNVTYDDVYGELPEAGEKEGYTFAGWFTEENENGMKITENIVVDIDDDHTLYAHWIINNYTLTFVFNNGKSDEVRILNYSGVIDYPENPTREGYTFNGWDNKGITNMPAYNLIITAQWTINNYTLTFVFNNNESDDNMTTLNYGDLIIYPEDPIREGYTFNGWLNYTVSMPAYNLVVTAQWTPNNYTVYLNANGGSNTTASWKVIFDSVYGDLQTPSREGYIFTGWFTETPGGSLVNFSTVVSFAYDHTIYAHWEIIQYTISFILSDEGDYDNITQDYDSLISFPEMSKTGYTFVCWCSDPSLTIEYTAKRVESRNVTLYAKWEANNYTVLFDSKGGSSVNSIVVTYGQDYGNLPTPTKGESEFLWWEMNETGQRVWNGTVVETTHNHTLCAVWNVNEISFFDPYGTCDLASVNVTYGKNYGNLPAPTRAGYTFAGWFFNETSTEPVTNDINVTIPYPHTLYARWRINSYSVTFNPDNDEEIEVKLFEFNSTITYPKDPEKKGYTFSGWNNGLDYMPAENVTITAMWIPNNYTVTFDVDGNFLEKVINVTFNTSYGTLPAPSRTGHTFAGWTDSLFGGNEINNFTIVNVPNNHTLYALWTVNKYTMTFMSDGMEPVNITLNYNDIIIYPNENPSKSFHKFRKWCTRGESGEEECNVTHVPDHNLTFTASFNVDSSLVAGTAVGAFAVILFIILIIVIVFLIRVTRTVKHKYEVVGIELDEDINERNEDIEERIRQQVEATSISVDIKKKLENPLKKADKSKGVEEVLMDLEVDCEDTGNIGIINSYRTTSASAVVANAINNEKNLIAAAEYLTLLYSSVREQEEHEKFSELYFGMKDVDDFMNNMDEKAICFNGIVSGFTSKKVAIQSLISREEEEAALSMPSGVLFRVQNGMGYRIGKVDEGTDEVLFELCSSFKVESMKEINKDKYIVVNLSFVSPKMMMI